MTRRALSSRARWRRALLASGFLALAVSACAPRTPPPVVPAVPRFPDFVFPIVPDRLGDARLRGRHEAAWAYVQAGNLAAASREYTDIVRRTPAFYPAGTALGYVLVAETRFRDAIARFDQVLRQAPRYAPALAGRGEALAGDGQVELAIASFEEARAADPRLTDLGRRIDALRFARVNDLVARAGRASAAGRYDEARQAYQQALASAPDSAFLYRDLGVAETRAGLLGEAIGHLERAVALDADDATAWAALAEAYERNGRGLDAVVALERAVEIDPSEALRKALERARDRAEFSRLPAEYRGLGSAPQINRGDLAALLGVRVLPALPSQRQRAGVVVTDARSHWAATWILSVTRAGLMDVYPNHTFQPASVVRRVDLAAAVSRVLTAIGPDPARPARRQAIADMPADHLSYPAVSAAVSAGVLPLLEGGAFRPSRVVTGAEALDVVGRLEALAKRARSGGSRR